jgi:hypothetical protein
VALLLIKWNPLIKVVLQWKLADFRKFGLNKMQLFLPAVQISELTFHLEISITCCAVASYTLIYRKQDLKSRIDHQQRTWMYVRKLSFLVPRQRQWLTFMNGFSGLTGRFRIKSQ